MNKLRAMSCRGLGVRPVRVSRRPDDNLKPGVRTAFRVNTPASHLYSCQETIIISLLSKIIVRIQDIFEEAQAVIEANISGVSVDLARPLALAPVRSKLRALVRLLR